MKSIADRLKVGSICFNDVLTHYGIASLPFGGAGFSGIGKIHGIEGLRSFCRVKSIVVNRFDFINEPTWWGRPKIVEKVLNRFAKLLFR